MTQKATGERDGYPADNLAGHAENLYTDNQFIKSVSGMDGYAHSGSIADDVGCTRKLVHIRMDALVEQGRMDMERIGRQKVWTLPE